MGGSEKTKQELIEELKVLRAQVAKLERTKEALRESEERYRNIFENANDEIAYLDTSGRIMEVNPVIEDIFGYKPEEVLGKNFAELDFFEPEDLPEMVELFKDVLEREKTRLRNLKARHISGREIFIEANTSLVRKGGKSEGILIVVRDVTERQRSEAILKESEERFRTIVETAPSFLQITDAEGNNIYVSPNCEELTSYTQEELLDKMRWWVHEDDTPRAKEIYERTFREGMEGKDFEYKALKKNGELWYASSSWKPIRDEEGKFKGIVFQTIDVTKRKQAEETLRESEQRFRAAANCTSDLIYEDNSETGQVDWYGDINGLLGYEPGEFPSTFQGWKNSLHPDDLDRVLSEIKNCADTDGVYCVEYRIKHKDGTYRYWVDRGTVFQKKGKPRKTVGACEDITERKQAEEALQKSEEKYRTLVEVVPGSIFLLNEKGQLLFMNRKAAENLGGVPKDFIDKTIWELFPQTIADRHMQTIGKIFATGVGVETEAISEIQGRNKWFHTNLQPIKNMEGKTTSVLGISLDITERKQADQALRESESKHRTLLENLPQKIFYKDVDSVYISCNDNYAKDLRIEPEEIAGRTDYEFYPENLAEKYRTDDKRIMESGKTEEIEEEYVRDGEEFIVHTLKTPVRDEKENIIGILGVFWDITERRRIDTELHQYREKMVQIERLASLGAIGATLAHQLNQPLTVIQLMLENSKTRLKKTSCPKIVLKNIKEGLKAAAQVEMIVQSFRDLARLPGQPFEEKINLQKIADQVALVLSEKARQVQLQLVIEDMNNLPQGIGDKTEIEQIFFILVENSIQAADGKKERQLTIRAALQDSELRLEFADDCGGIAPENLHKIFEPFFTTKPRGQGTGLGLSIVQQILTRRHGTIRVESQAGRGITFYITLPWIT
ncbi:MAG: hypothetical protein AMJ79_12015 [Phycisphaerae bacterium SM23_30]|nr:MAG: hypothetical protein AMJ79_12015 [Phycisphaerae bacterium SM23_30]